jgi:F420H(2)-dependent biliverdin reductase
MPTSTERFITEPNVWLGTTRADGRPHLVPIWFVWVHRRVWIATDARSVKVRNIAANPFATFALEDGNRPVVIEITPTKWLFPSADTTNNTPPI